MKTTSNEFKAPEPQKNGINWDKFYSTYYWKIYLDENHPKNSTSVEFLQGYSKVENQRESADSTHLLKTKIFNLYKNGYFERAKKIEIYQRLDEIINTKNDIKILILKPKEYQINPDYSDIIFKNFGLFLEDFYNRIIKAAPMDNIVTYKRKAVNNTDFLNVNTVKLNNLQQLYSYAARLSLNGHPSGEVTHFINKYKEKKQW
jgi:hypothetical protein